MIPRLPIRRDNFVADDYLLFFFPSAFNFDFFHFFLTFLQWYSHVNLQVDSDLAIKKPAKKSFRVLAGIGYKPKRLCATFFIKIIIHQFMPKSKKICLFNTIRFRGYLPGLLPLSQPLTRDKVSGREWT